MIGKKTPLHDWHSANGARFMEFGGWQLPEIYGKHVEQEYASLRNGAGLIDLSYESRIRVEGDDAEIFLNEMVTIDLQNMQPRTVRHCFVCNQKGGIIDQVILYRDQSYFLILGSAPARYALLDWLEKTSESRSYQVNVADVTTAQGQVQLLGNAAPTVLRQVGVLDGALDPGAATVATIDNARCLIFHRMTDGYDLITGSVYIQPLWERLADTVTKMGSRPVGMRAREIYRVESGQPLHGKEIDEETTPLELGQGAMCDFRKKDFNGRRALMHSVSAEFQRQLSAFRIEAESPAEAGAEIVMEGFPLGRLTSVAISPVMRCKLALGFVSSLNSKPGNAVTIQNADGKSYRATIMKPGQLQARP